MISNNVTNNGLLLSYEGKLKSMLVTMETFILGLNMATNYTTPLLSFYYKNN